MITPKYKHDCDRCRFLGRLDGKDAYVHDSLPTGLVTLLLRASDDGPDYVSRSFLPDEIMSTDGRMIEPYATIRRMG